MYVEGKGYLARDKTQMHEEIISEGEAKEQLRLTRIEVKVSSNNGITGTQKTLTPHPSRSEEVPYILREKNELEF